MTQETPGIALSPATIASRRRRNSANISFTSSRGPVSAATPASWVAGAVQETELISSRVIGSTSSSGSAA